MKFLGESNRLEIKDLSDLGLCRSSDTSRSRRAVREEEGLFISGQSSRLSTEEVELLKKSGKVWRGSAGDLSMCTTAIYYTKSFFAHSVR
jgi:hypothetical protein